MEALIDFDALCALYCKIKHGRLAESVFDLSGLKYSMTIPEPTVNCVERDVLVSSVEQINSTGMPASIELKLEAKDEEWVSVHSTTTKRKHPANINISGKAKICDISQVGGFEIAGSFSKALSKEKTKTEGTDKKTIKSNVISMVGKGDVPANLSGRIEVYRCESNVAENYSVQQIVSGSIRMEISHLFSTKSTEIISIEDLIRWLMACKHSDALVIAAKLTAAQYELGENGNLTYNDNGRIEYKTMKHRFLFKTGLIDDVLQLETANKELKTENKKLKDKAANKSNVTNIEIE